MRRYFECKFVRTDEMIVAVDTDEAGDIADRVEIPDEVGDSFFGRDAFRSMVFEEVNELTEDGARSLLYPDGFEDIPVLPLGDGESSPQNNDDVALGGNKA
jgi:hypothetical protein